MTCLRAITNKQIKLQMIESLNFNAIINCFNESFSEKRNVSIRIMKILKIFTNQYCIVRLSALHVNCMINRSFKEKFEVFYVFETETVTQSK
jgi:hypothetical protein